MAQLIQELEPQTGRSQRAAGLAMSRRPLFWVGIYVLILASWIALYAQSLATSWPAAPDRLSADLWSSLCLSAGEASFPALFGMWALMVAAMMLPSLLPSLRVFAELADVKASTSQSLVALVLGYLAVWLVFSAGAAALQAELSGAGLLSAGGSSQGPWLTAALFLGAGAYQFSAVKNACLRQCRHPLIFFMQHWRPGNATALAMGLRLGVYCAGCCWALMLLGFAGGTMNLLWMAAATLFMAFEKLPAIGNYLTRPAGLALLLAGFHASAQALGLW